MGKRVYMVGKRFGRLVVMEETDRRSASRHIIYKCKCDCGNEKYVSGNALRSNLTTSCGCLAREKSKENIMKANNEYDIKKFKDKYYKDGTILCFIDEKRKNSNNKSTIKGVYWDKKRKKWRAQIVFRGKNYTLGRFMNIEDAKEARQKAEEKFYKPILDKYKV